MPGFSQQPIEKEQVDQKVSRRNARYGLVLFFVYASLYAVFMVLNAFARGLMASPVLGGINLAVLYGLALILSAFLFALVYAWLCRATRPGGGGQ